MNKENTDIIPFEKMPECFAAALSYFLKYRPFPNMTQTRLAEIVGVTQGYITKLASGKVSGAEEVRRKIAAVYGYDGSEHERTYDEFLKIGYAVTSQPETQKEHPENSKKKTTFKENLNIKLRKAHLKLLINETRGLIDQFQDKETAHGLNKLLLEIERNDPQRLLEIYEYVKLIHAFSQNKKND